MKKAIVTITAVLAAALSLGAQNVESKQDYSQFTSIEARKYFEVKLCYGATYSTKIVADQLIADYVKVYVKGNTLCLEVDEKSFPPEVKKALKGKNAIVPVLRAEVYAPTINGISLFDNAVLYSEDNIKAAIAKIELKNNAVIRNLTLDAQDVSVKMGNKSQARFDIYTNSITVDASGNSSATFALNCSSMAVGTAGSANVNINVETKNIAVKSESQSILTLTGTANKFSVEGGNSSSIYSDGLVAEQADVALMNSALCEVNSTSFLKVDLMGSSHLIFNGKPNIDVVRIVNSTMTRAGDTKYKKK